MDFETFYQSLLPGNYALTKSMELTRHRRCGTLWYMKKFLVLYYYIFLSSDIETRAYIPKVTEAFQNYLSDLDDTVRPEAERFFFPENELINFRSPALRSFMDFAGKADFATPKEKADFLEQAKKYYFVFLMETGGQSGINHYLKTEHLYRADFTMAQLPGIIRAYARCEPKNLTQIINDYHASLRNERQVMYYYGFFHSKSTGMNEREFSSLTPVGALALHANSREFLAIWEHQKLKMVSQPLTVRIDSLPEETYAYENFSVSCSPYRDLLDCLHRRGSLSYDGYKLVISRLNGHAVPEEWAVAEEQVLERLDAIKARVDAFGRLRDQKNEDSDKELRKYLLGLRSDLKKDCATLFSGCVALSRQGIRVTDQARLRQICAVYDALDAYKIEKYGELFDACKEELKKKYLASAQKQRYQVDAQIKIRWDLYNIRPDDTILFGVAALLARLESGLPFAQESELIQYLWQHYKGLLRALGVNSAAAAQAMLAPVVRAAEAGDFRTLVPAGRFTYPEQAKASYLAMSSADLKAQMVALSREKHHRLNGKRQRSQRLVNLMKSYLVKCFGTPEKVLRCECCSQETFLTKYGEPYVELHHLIPFGDSDGPDHYLNLFALCPNCHRRLHYLPVAEKETLYQQLSRRNYLRLTLVERLKTLRREKQLFSYQLEFLLADRAITQTEYHQIATMAA